MVLPFVVCGLWAAALYFFMNSLTNWQVDSLSLFHCLVYVTDGEWKVIHVF